MPTYDYLCGECNYKFEEFHSMTAESLEQCPKCSGPLQRLIGPGNGLIFKGSGFYSTDYKNSNNNPEKKSTGVNKTKKTEKAENKPTKESSDKKEA